MNDSTTVSAETKPTKPTIRITRIATHEGFHYDEAVAFLLLQEFGEAKFPGVSTAKLEFWKPSDINKNDASERKRLVQGILCVGICGGDFDEHPTATAPGKDNECAATLVAKVLGIEHEPSLQEILKYAVRADTTSTTQPRELPTLMKHFHKQNPVSDLKLWEIIEPLIRAEWWVQKQFLACEKEIEEHGLIDTFEDVQTGRELRILAAETDNTEMQKYARAQGCAVTMQKRSSGQVQIFVDKKYRLNLDVVAARIRNAEREANGLKPISDPAIVTADGNKVEGAEVWYYHRVGQFLLNGSLTTTDMPPTKVDWGNIIKIVFNNIGAR